MVVDQLASFVVVYFLSHVSKEEAEVLSFDGEVFQAGHIAEELSIVFKFFVLGNAGCFVAAAKFEVALWRKLPIGLANESVVMHVAEEYALPIFN